MPIIRSPSNCRCSLWFSYECGGGSVLSRGRFVTLLLLLLLSLWFLCFRTLEMTAKVSKAVNGQTYDYVWWTEKLGISSYSLSSSDFWGWPWSKCVSVIGQSVSWQWIKSETLMSTESWRRFGDPRAVFVYYSSRSGDSWFLAQTLFRGLGPVW